MTQTTVSQLCLNSRICLEDALHKCANVPHLVRLDRHRSQVGSLPLTRLRFQTWGLTLWTLH